MKKRRIAIASILKPVDDTRAFGKMAQSLSRAGIADIYLIGFPTGNKPDLPENIHFLPLTFFGRLSIGRWFAPWKVLHKLRQVKPDILIVNTHELLIVAIVNRILFGTRIVYDIQENYYQNILWTTAFPRFLRWPIAQWVRWRERLLTPFFHRLVVAEQCYLHELPFAKQAVALENKCVRPSGFVRQPIGGEIKLIFTGTLAESTGVFEAIDLADQLHQLDSRVSLTILGRCTQPETLRVLQQRVQSRDFVHLVGGASLVPHTTIEDAIATASFGIICYPLSPQNRDRMPTKLYEYLALQLPILIQGHEPWAKLVLQHRAGLVVDFERIEQAALLQQMRSATFYGHPTRAFEWESDEPRFLELIASL